MSINNTISISPISGYTTIQDIKKNLSAYNICNIHIDNLTAYVEFSDASEIQSLEIKFPDFTIPSLNNAKIDIAENIDWGKIKDDVQKENKNSSNDSNNSSERHEDILAVDVQNLIVLKNCDETILLATGNQQIKELFKSFSSVNRILKKKNQVIVEFLDLDEIQLLETKFNDLKVPQLGSNCVMESAEQNNIRPQDFVSEWSKTLQPKSARSGAKQQVQVLHSEIIPPFDKKTSMQVNYINQQQQYGYGEELNKRDPIIQANTYQQLGYPFETKIQSGSNLGYQQQHKRIQQDRKKLQQQQKKLKKIEEERLKKIQQEAARKMQQDQERRRHHEEHARQEQRRIQQQEEKRRREGQEREEKRKKQEAEREEKIKREKQQNQREQKERQQKQQRQKQQKQRQRQKVQRQKQTAVQKQETHHIPSKSEQVSQQTEFIKKAGETIEQQLGYAVNMAKAESANLVNAGIELLKKKKEQTFGYSVEEAKKILPDVNQYIGYEETLKKQILPSPKKDEKKQDIYGYNTIQQGTSQQKWRLKPEEVQIPIVQRGKEISRTLITITLVIWVLFLLLQ